jgi:hypothetical protein
MTSSTNPDAAFDHLPPISISTIVTPSVHGPGSVQAVGPGIAVFFTIVDVWNVPQTSWRFGTNGVKGLASGEMEGNRQLDSLRVSWMGGEVTSGDARRGVR